MGKLCLLAVIQSDLPLICQLRAVWEDEGRGLLRVARNTEEVALYMRGVGIYANRSVFPLPDVIALDCQNANGSDLEVLAWLRETPEFRHLPVALLCPENHPASSPLCALDAASYFVDRTRLDELVRTTDHLGSGGSAPGFPEFNPAPPRSTSPILPKPC